ncbi:hypothetical protein BASA81_006801 [Batrachochytrium salamandrivorans]|nr:hypothetical protein BASA81_006801 [Batrachochytrium salamandrivorans]
MLSFALFALLLVGLSDLSDLATAKRLGGRGLHFLVLQRDGQVFAVGCNRYGQLGLNTTTKALLPQAMLSVTNATDVSTGTYHSCLIGQGNKVKCAGDNDDRQLGDGTNTERHMLVSTLGLDSGIEELHCGYYGSCARMTSGKAQCWGDFASVTRTSPVNSALPGGIQSMSLGSLHACIVAVGGKLYCVGNDDYGRWSHVLLGGYQAGQLGNPNITSDSSVPVQVTGITSGAASAWTAWYNSFALMQNGTVLAFGRDIYGVFGTGSTGTKYVPIVFGQGVSGVVEIRGGYYTTCVLLQNDQVMCTGQDYYGQLGVGNNVTSLTLVEMQLPTLAPNDQPTLAPTNQPTLAPSAQPTLAPSTQPTLVPTKQPTLAPTNQPTLTPGAQPTLIPTEQPTLAPTLQPTLIPTKQPTLAPTAQPTLTPSAQPTKTPTSPTTPSPTKRPTKAPTATPHQGADEETNQGSHGQANEETYQDSHGQANEATDECADEKAHQSSHGQANEETDQDAHEETHQGPDQGAHEEANHGQARRCFVNMTFLQTKSNLNADRGEY